MLNYTSCSFVNEPVMNTKKMALWDRKAEWGDAHRFVAEPETACSGC
jgi:hypothetical protein